MKANQFTNSRNDRAEVGVGTLIVFIAMVLVAAVAAAVLINTTGTLQQRAQSTGKEATQEVASNIKIVDVYGTRLATGDITDLKIDVSLAAGALPMDLEQLVVRYSDGTNTAINYKWETYDGTPGADKLQVNWIRGDGTADGTSGKSVMKSGDLVEIHVVMDNDIPVRTACELTLIPEAGSPVAGDFKTPATYGSDTSITLR